MGPDVGVDDFERLLMTQSFRVALLNVVVNTDGPCGLISCFFSTDDRQLSDSSLFFARDAAVVVGKRLSEVSTRLLAQTNG